MRSIVLLFWTVATHTSIVMMPTHMYISVYYINYTSDTVIKHSKPLLWLGIWCNDPWSISHYSWDEEKFTVNETAFPIICFITPSHFTSVRTIHPHLSKPFSLRTPTSLRTSPYICPSHSSKTINCISLWARGVCHHFTYPYTNLGAFTSNSQNLKKYVCPVNVQSLIYREQSRHGRVCLHKWFGWKSTTCDTGDMTVSWGHT